MFLFGLCSGIISLMSFSKIPTENPDSSFLGGKQIALKLFTEYLLIFEMIGLLLLLVAIGVVVLSRLDEEK